MPIELVVPEGGDAGGCVMATGAGGLEQATSAVQAPTSVSIRMIIVASPGFAAQARWCLDLLMSNEPRRMGAGVRSDELSAQEPERR